MVKSLPAMLETWVWSLDQEDPLVKDKATHSSILPWEIPWWRSLVGYSPQVCMGPNSWAWLSDFTLKGIEPGQARPSGLLLQESEISPGPWQDSDGPWAEEQPHSLCGGSGSSSTSHNPEQAESGQHIVRKEVTRVHVKPTSSNKGSGHTQSVQKCAT